MKLRCTLGLVALLLAGWAMTAWSQPEPSPPPFQEGQPPFEGPPDAPPPPEFGGPPPFGEEPGGPRERMEGRRGGQSLELWLEHMRRENPEEFERMRLLREEDPEAFRRALRERRDELRNRGPREPFPGGPPGQGYQRNRPPEQRRHGMDERGGERSQQRMRHPENQEILNLERQVQDVVERYHETPEPEKETVRGQIREHLGKLFELREEQRRRQIERMARKLEGLEEAMEKRAAQRDAIIDRRMGELLGEDPLAW